MKSTWKKWTLAGTAGILLCAVAFFLYGNLGFADQTLGIEAELLADTEPVTRGVADKLEQVKKDTSKELGTAENPFVILEIVPYEGYAEFGYLISGCEPVDMDRLVYYGDMATVASTESITTEWKNYYYFGEEEEYQKAEAEKATGTEGFVSIGDVNWSLDVWGYYEVVEEGKGSFRQVNQEDTGTYAMEWAGEGRGNIAWHSANDGTVVTEAMKEKGRQEEASRQLNKVGEKLYTLRNSLTTSAATGEDGKPGSGLYTFDQYSYKNQNYFLKNSLGISEEEIENYCVVIKTITPKELNKSVSEGSSHNWVTVADLIMVSPKSHIGGLPKVWEKFNKLNKEKINDPASDFVKNDLSWEAVMAIYEKVLAEDDYAGLIMDATAYMIGSINGTDSLGKNVKADNVTYDQLNWDGELNGYPTKATGCSNNVYKLGIMLRCMNPQLFYNLYMREFDGKAPLIEKVEKKGNGASKTTGSFRIQEEDRAKEYWNACAFMPSNEDGTGRWKWEWDSSTCYNPTLEGNTSVSKHIYTYNGDNSLNQIFMNAGITNGNYTKELFDWLKSQGKDAEKAYPYQAVDYIIKDKINGEKPEGFKAEIAILEIQPCNTFSLGERRFYFMIPDFTGRISVEQQTSSEFLGKTEDLNSLYDMIYFGTNDEAMRNSDQLKLTMFEDGSACVYRHTGSKVTVSKDKGKDIKKLRGSFGDTDTNDAYYYSGNDITKIREKELIDFAAAGYPVVFDSGFFKETEPGKFTVDEEKIDSASNVYDFAQKLAAGDYTLYREGYMEKDGTLKKFKAALTMKHCTLVLNPDTPLRYRDRTYTAADGSQPYKDLTDEEIYVNGGEGKLDNLRLDFEFFIDDDNASEEEVYGVVLHIDTNADGRYVEDEEQNILVYEYDPETKTLGKQMKNTRLQANTSYKLICIADEYVGVLPWKLEIYRRDNKKIRDMEMGMSAVKIHVDQNGDGKVEKDDRERMNVLQIASDNNNVTLPTDTERKGFDPNIEDEKKTVSQKFHEYTAELQEFDIHFTRCTVSEFMKESNGYIADVNSGKYNMLILGFADMYTDISNEAALDAIEGAIERGVSVLFTHDTTSFVNLSKNKYNSVTGGGDFWGYHINKYFREIVGMDRYGVVLQYPLASTGEKPKTLEECLQDGKDVPYMTGKTQNLTDSDKDGKFENVYLVAANSQSYVTGNPPTMKDYCDHNSDKWWEVRDERGHQWRCNYKSKKGNRGCEKNMQQIQSHDEKTVVITKAPTETSTGTRAYYCSVCAYKVREEEIPMLSTSKYYAVQGYSNPVLYRYSQNGGANQYTQKVTQTNTGQITEYPYKIDETFSVANTHSQYYQLDMEADDIVVWYCLAGSGYDLSPNDARNNYYIYNRGNITYSGVGHDGNLTDTEIKLFVNTMVSAYNASAVLPKIEITNVDKVPMGDAEGMYISYDYGGTGSALNLADFIQDSVDISYKVIENNILSRKKVTVKYYLLGEEQADGTWQLAPEEAVLDGTYYSEDSDSKRKDLHTFLGEITKNTVGVGETDDPKQENGDVIIKANEEYSFQYNVIEDSDGDGTLESLFEKSPYIPLEIEITLTYGKKLDKTKIVRKPIILYRRALFNLD